MHLKYTNVTDLTSLYIKLYWYIGNYSTSYNFFSTQYTGKKTKQKGKQTELVTFSVMWVSHLVNAVGQSAHVKAPHCVIYSQYLQKYIRNKCFCQQCVNAGLALSAIIILTGPLRL